MKKLTRVFAVLLALIMVLSVVACGGKTDPSKEETKPTTESKGSDESQGSDETDAPTESEIDHDARYGGHANIRVTNCVAYGPDPLKNFSLWKYMFLNMVFEGALTTDADGNMAPAVCDYELSEDGLTLKLWVREGKKFTNGDLVDIYDVEASIRRALNRHSSTKTYVVPYLEEGYPKLDEAAKTLTIKFTEYHEKELYYAANYRPFWAIMPKEICEKYAADDAFIVDCADAIGTCGYVFTDFVEKEFCRIERAEGWEVYDNGDMTGFAGTRYNYLDSITYWVCSDDGAAALATISGDYDCVECIPADYMDMAKASGIKETICPSNVGTGIYFAVDAAAKINACSVYPSLRKAVMAAIDYEEYLKVITDNQQILGDCPWLGSDIKTDAWEKADYYGPTNTDAVAKYLAEAKKEGWDGVEPVVFSYSTSRSDIPTLFKDAMEKAGIPVVMSLLDSGALTDFRKDVPENTNKWDATFNWPTWGDTPFQEPSEMYTWWNEDEYRNGLKAQMDVTPRQSAEYKKLVDDYAKYLVETCGYGYMSYIGWYWYTPETLMVEDEGLTRYFFNTYWADPENHPEK